MTGIRPEQRGLISGLLNLSRNLGLITGASVMGAVLAFASRAAEVTVAHAEAVAIGMSVTFAASAALIVAAIAVGVITRRR